MPMTKLKPRSSNPQPVTCNPQPVIFMDYVISSDPTWVDVDLVWRFLSEESYWARGIRRETVLKSLPHSILFSVYEIGPQSRREQVGFATGNQ
jgi:hypothetical protein